MNNRDVVSSISDEIVSLEQYAKGKYIDGVEWYHIIDMLNDENKLRYYLLQMIKSDEYSDIPLATKFERYVEEEAYTIDDDGVMRETMSELFTEFDLSWSDFDRVDFTYEETL